MSFGTLQPYQQSRLTAAAGAVIMQLALRPCLRREAGWVPVWLVPDAPTSLQSFSQPAAAC